jgi:integrase
LQVEKTPTVVLTWYCLEQDRITGVHLNADKLKCAQGCIPESKRLHVMTSEIKNPDSRIKRARKGLGRIYKRDANGKEHKGNSKKRGAFWLEYRIEGQRQRVALQNDKGDPVTNLRDAEKARQRVVAPLQANTEAERWEAVQAKVAAARTQESTAIRESRDPATPDKGWSMFLASNTRPDSGERTLKDYEGYFKRFIKWLKESQAKVETLDKVTPVIADAYARTLNGGKLSANSYNKHVGFLKLYYKSMADELDMDRNPFERITRKKHRATSRRELTIEELGRVLAYAKGDMATLFGLGTFTGMRLGDCATLRWSEVDLTKGIIRRVPNKTSRTSPDRIVTIGIPNDLHKHLSEAPPEKRGDYVLPKIAHKYEHTRPELARKVQAVFLQCGIDVHKKGTGSQIVRDQQGLPELDDKGKVQTEPTGEKAVVEVGFHSLRHTYVSLNAESGTPAAIIQANVGHSNPAMTRHYTHLSPDAALRHAEALPEAIARPADRKSDLLQIVDVMRELAESLSEKNLDNARLQLVDLADRLARKPQ